MSAVTKQTTEDGREGKGTGRQVYHASSSSGKVRLDSGSNKGNGRLAMLLARI